MGWIYRSQQRGCAVKPKYIVDNFSVPGRVAVLPMANQTNDFDGEKGVRNLFQAGLHPDRRYHAGGR